MSISPWLLEAAKAAGFGSKPQAQWRHHPLHGMAPKRINCDRCPDLAPIKVSIDRAFPKPNASPNDPPRALGWVGECPDCGTVYWDEIQTGGSGT